MPIKKSAFKSLRQSKKRALKNKKIISDTQALIRKVRKTIATKDSAKAQELLKQVIKKLDKAAQKGVIKKNTVARTKSRLATAVWALGKKS